MDKITVGKWVRFSSLWKLVVYVDAFSDVVDELRLSRVQAFLFPALLYTTFVMASAYLCLGLPARLARMRMGGSEKRPRLNVSIVAFSERAMSVQRCIVKRNTTFNVVYKSTRELVKRLEYLWRKPRVWVSQHTGAGDPPFGAPCILYIRGPPRLAP